MKTFNINNSVGVKLTDEGLKILEHQHNELLQRMPPDVAERMGSFIPPEVDEDGYSQFQLCELMHYFGNYIYSGNLSIPFETEIKISDEYLIEPTIEKSRSR